MEYCKRKFKFLTNFKKAGFYSNFLKLDTDGAVCSSKWRVFQSLGPAEENSQSAKVFLLL